MSEILTKCMKKITLLTCSQSAENIAVIALPGGRRVGLLSWTCGGRVCI